MSIQLLATKDSQRYAAAGPGEAALQAKPRLSIIIVNYNTAAFTEQCISSIYRCPPDVPFDLIVVDNASKDGSPELIAQAFPRARIIANSHNRGFAAGNNDALRLATGDYILLLNSDTIIKVNSLSGMVQFLDSHPKAGAVGVQLVKLDGSHQVSFARFHSILTVLVAVFPLPRLVPAAIHNHLGPYVASRLRNPFVVDYVSGAALMLRKTTLKEVGYLDEGYFMYSEEMDWCWRARQRGWKAYGLPYLEIVHMGGGSSEGNEDWRTRQLAISRNLFIRKNRPRYYLVAFYACMLFSLVAWAGVFSLLNLVLLGRVGSFARAASRYRHLLRLEGAVVLRPSPVQEEVTHD